MISWFSIVIGLIASHPHFAYGVVFLLALSESISIIGAVVLRSAAPIVVEAA